MKDCTDCRHAAWKRTSTGRSHPSGDGRCQYPWKLPPLPASMFWISLPSPNGGHINRRELLKDHCTYYERKPA